MGEILEALRRADEERERREAPRVVHRAPEPSFPPLPRCTPEPEYLTEAQATEAQREARATGSEPALPESGQRVEISRLKSDPWVARAVLLHQGGAVAESYRHFAVTVRARITERGARSVVVTSALGAEGKTTTACNLAFASASIAGGARVALVDLDLRHPSVATALGVVPHAGIDSVLVGRGSLDEARVVPDVEGLDFYLLARSLPRAHEILAGPVLGTVVQALEQLYDLVIIDSPPSLLVPDVSLLLRHAGSYLTVVRTGVTRLSALRAMLKQLPREKFLGPFVNEAQRTRHIVDYAYYHEMESDDDEKQGGR